MAIESLKCGRHSLVCRSTTRPTMVGPEKIFKLKVLRRLYNTILRLLFANTVFHKGVILLICQGVILLNQNL